MSIKNNKPSKKSGFKQGYFPINECKKYAGKGPIIYRSSWEYKFCKYCESNSSVLKWVSEPFEIRYINSLDGREHKYWADFLIVLEGGKKYLIEIKPKSMLQKPNPPKRKTAKQIKSYKYAYEQYVTNMCKIESAEKFCNERGIEFKIITEDFFKTV